MIDFLPASEAKLGDGSWTLASESVALDTSPAAVLPVLPTGVTFLAGTQRDGSSVMILRVRELVVSGAATLRVTGTRPFFLLAEDVTIAGLLDVGARGGTPGPGGGVSGAGAGAGAASIHDIDGSQTGYSGAGGGSFGTRGATGGGVVDDFSPAGMTYEIGANRLVGGASGGTSGATSDRLCNNTPGAGGGAILIYAKNRIEVSGQISAGGGGGGGGLTAVCPNIAYAGAGGGSGGAIWLQTRALNGTGVLAANGGGGGGASSNAQNGTAGEDAKASVSAAAAGGPRGMGATPTTDGGAGAISSAGASSIITLANTGRGGGGGGGLGRIVTRAEQVSSSLQSSPTAVRAP